MVTRVTGTEGGERVVQQRGRKGLPEKVALEKDLRGEPWEHLREGNILAEETAGTKALGRECPVFS